MFRPFVLAATIAVGAGPATSAPSEQASDQISYLMNELEDIREIIEDREAATTEVGGWFSAGAAD